MGDPQRQPILILGCDGLLWSRRAADPYRRPEWESGRFDARTCFPAEPSAAADAPPPAPVSLFGELDPGIWRPRPGNVLQGLKVGIAKRIDRTPAVLPPWDRQVSNLARRITNQLGQSGVLVAPFSWLGTERGRDLLRAWADNGWSLAPLLETLRQHLPGKVRFVTAAGATVRITEPDTAWVTANGPAAARALAAAPLILDQILDRVDSALAERWLREEEPITGWFVRQRLVEGIHHALDENNQRVGLGGSDGPLFRFSSEDAGQEYSELAAIRLDLRLPTAGGPQWWHQISQPGILENADETSPFPGIRWERMSTAVVAGPGTAALEFFLKSKRLHHTMLDPVGFDRAFTLAAPLKTWTESISEDRGRETESSKTTLIFKDLAERISKMREASESTADGVATGDQPPSDASEVESAAAPVEPAAVAPPLDDAAREPRKTDAAVSATASPPLAGFDPQQLTVDLPHVQEQLRVRVDGEPIDHERIHRVPEADAGGNVYELDGIVVAHGAIVRVDIEAPVKGQ